MSGISLTASMRSNLLSLKNTSSLIDMTQNRLSTGNKVNSAIDNPSSYYTARSLNNRANDLSSLLDSMGQAVSTIKAATEAMESGAEILEQASAVANQTLIDAGENTVQLDIDKAINQQNAERLTNISDSAPDRAWLLANGADFVVETEAELRDALSTANSGQKIVINGNINIEINNSSERLIVADGVEVIGATALNANAINKDGSYIGKLNIVNNTSYSSIIFNGNNLLSDLQFILTSKKMASGIDFNGGKIKNINVINNGYHALKTTSGNSEIIGNINIKQSGLDRGIAIFLNGVTNINADINIHTTSNYAHGVTIANIVNILNESKINIKTEGLSAACLDVQKKGTLNISSAKMNLISEQNYIILSECWDAESGGNTVKISSGVKINAKGNALFRNVASQTINPNTGNKENYFEVEEGVKIFFEDNSGYKGKYISKAWTNSNTHSDDNKKSVIVDFAEMSQNGWTYEGNLYFPDDYEQNKQFISILNQYDSLMNDSSYKGVNLLNNEGLSVRFNEDGQSKLDITGKDMKVASLGIKTQNWQTAEDVAQSIAEIASAMKQIRSYNSELGNNYSIITNRQSFTENLINVLTEGADKLTLADMNEESANVLALQTRQQLAINSLSLAAQAAQAVLKLF